MSSQAGGVAASGGERQAARRAIARDIRRGGGARRAGVLRTPGQSLTFEIIVIVTIDPAIE